MRFVYFASVREAIGRDEDEFDLPASIANIEQVLDWLKGQGEEYQRALADPVKLRFALDQQMVKPGASLEGAQELAIFPPVTGG